MSDDAALVAAVGAGAPGAQEALYLRTTPILERVLLRPIGPDRELADLLHTTPS